MEATLAAPVSQASNLSAQDSINKNTSPQSPPRDVIKSAQESLERAIMTFAHTPPKAATAQDVTNNITCKGTTMATAATSQTNAVTTPIVPQPAQATPLQNIKMTTLNSLERTIVPQTLVSQNSPERTVAAQSPSNSLPTPNPGGGLFVSPAHHNTIITPQGVWQNVAAPAIPQHTLPAVHNFLQLAFQTVQRTNQPQLASTVHRAFPPTLVVTPRSPLTSAPAPFRTLKTPTSHSSVPTTSHSPDSTPQTSEITQSTSAQTKQTMTPERSHSLNEKTISTSNSATITKSQTCPSNMVYNTSIAGDSKLQETSVTSPKRTVLVAKRRQSPKSPVVTEAQTLTPVKTTQPSSKAQNAKSPKTNAAKVKDSIVKSSSRVVQTYKEYQRQHSGQDGQSGQSQGSNAAVKNCWRRANRAQQERENAIDPKTRVLVSGFPAYTQSQDLVRVLTKFGRCQVDSCRNRLAVVTYETEAQAKSAISGSDDINIYGEFVEIKPYTNPQHVDELYKAYKKVISTQKGQDIIMPDKIDLTGDFYQQLENILMAIRITPEQVQAVNNLYSDLELVLQQEWPGCVTIPFGSIPTGLGMSSSDADCFVRLPAAARVRGAGGSAAAFVSRARRVLQQHPRVFSHLVAIPRANTPILKFKHLPSGFHCDVSAKTPLGAQNSRLLRLLLEHDRRLQRVALLLKYWAKVHELSGTGRLTNYALAMMVVFYLQQPRAGFLPPVEALQRDPATRYTVDHWNAGFSSQRLPVVNGEVPEHEILGGFFQFYAGFDFEADVVCPYLGRAVRKAAFDSPHRLPLELARYAGNVRDNLASPLRVGTAFCVQDPFEQSHNVASAVGPRLAHDIRAYFRFAADAFEAGRAAGCGALLRTLLLDKPDLRPERVVASSVVHLVPRVRLDLADVGWRARLREVVLDVIFDKILRLSLRREPDHEPGDEDKEKPRRCKLDRERYSGATRKPVWRRKKNNSVSPLDTPQSLVARQAALTEAILARAADAVFLYELELWFRDEPRVFNVSVKLVEGDMESFRQFVMFLHTAVVEWFRLLLRPLAAAAPAPGPAVPHAPSECTITFERAPRLHPRPRPLDPADVANSLATVTLAHSPTTPE